MNKRCGEKMIVKRIISMAWEGISVAEYRRFISYMYLYEDGRKTINSGFVRVENRDDQCRILIHMSGVYADSGIRRLHRYCSRRSSDPSADRRNGDYYGQCAFDGDGI